MRVSLLLLGRLCVTLALTFALAASGFAHAKGHSALTPELKAYVAAGGALADLCGGPGVPDGTGYAKCEACRLIGAALVPESCAPGAAVTLVQTRTLEFVARRLHWTKPLDPARQTRAPPLA